MRPDAHIVVDVYRFGGTVFKWSFVGTGTSGATFTDNLPDESILSAPPPSQITDPSTGVIRYNLNKPFVTQDVARFGTATARVTGNGIWWLQWASGDMFNEGWLQGSFCYRSTTLISPSMRLRKAVQRPSAEIVLGEDATGTLVAGTTYSWSTQGGTLTMGAPLPHLWGPYGTGAQGSVIFGCGDPDAAGTLYWTNGNDPDSQDLANSLVVTSPSERLTGGCVFNGIAYVFSTERMFQIFPSLTVSGQYYVQEIVGGKGLWMEWSLTVQSNSIADQSISWRGKDGIYKLHPRRRDAEPHGRGFVPALPAGRIKLPITSARHGDSGLRSAWRTPPAGYSLSSMLPSLYRRPTIRSRSTTGSHGSTVSCSTTTSGWYQA